MSVCFANSVDGFRADSEKIAAKKVSVVVFSSRSIRSDTKTMNMLIADVEKMFDPHQYNIEIFGQGQQSPAFVEFTEKFLFNQKSFVMKEDCLKYAQDTGSDYVISILIYPAEMKGYADRFSVSKVYKMQADIKSLDVKNNKYIYNQIFMSKKLDGLRSSTRSVLTNMREGLLLPEELKK